MPPPHLTHASPLADTRPEPHLAHDVFRLLGTVPGSHGLHVPLAPASPRSQLTHAVVEALSGLSFMPALQLTHARSVLLK